MKKIYKYQLLLYILIFISCSNNKDNEAKAKEPFSAGKTKQTLNEKLAYDVCICNQTALELINQAKIVRMKYSNIDELKSDELSKKKIVEIAKQFATLTEKCFTNNAAQLFVPSECNDVKLLETKQSELYSLGIKINQGSKVWK